MKFQSGALFDRRWRSAARSNWLASVRGYDRGTTKPRFDLGSQAPGFALGATAIEGVSGQLLQGTVQPPARPGTAPRKAICAVAASIE